MKNWDQACDFAGLDCPKNDSRNHRFHSYPLDGNFITSQVKVFAFDDARIAKSQA